MDGSEEGKVLQPREYQWKSIRLNRPLGRLIERHEITHSPLPPTIVMSESPPLEARLLPVQVSASMRSAIEMNSSSSNPQSMATLTSGDGSGKKVRKPYTITKSRESWTEEEHDKFLEALQLYVLHPCLISFFPIGFIGNVVK